MASRASDEAGCTVKAIHALFTVVLGDHCRAAKGTSMEAHLGSVQFGEGHENGGFGRFGAPKTETHRRSRPG